MRSLEVAAAVFQRDNKFLAARKKSGLSNEGQWEFPGGKRKPEETFETALVREIAEELSVSIKVGQSLGEYSQPTNNLIINLHCFIVIEWQGEFVPTDHDKLQWCSIDELKSLRLSDADVPFVDRISAYVQAHRLK